LRTAAGRVAVLRHREEEVLGGEVLVLELVGFLLRERRIFWVRRERPTWFESPLTRGSRASSREKSCFTRVGIGADGLEQGTGGPVGLIQERDGEVLGLDLRVGPVLGQGIGRLERLARFFGQLVQLHRQPSTFALCKRRASAVCNELLTL
jgi:hypothetical protein